MRVTRVVSGFIAVLMLASSVFSFSSAGEDVGIEVGDYWKYSMDVDSEGLTMEGSFEMKVADTATLGGKGVFNIDVSGSGSVSGSLDDMTISGSLDIAGSEVRFRSDFDLVSEDVVMDIDVGALGMTINMMIGFSTQYAPSMDDFIGDDNKTLDSVVTCEYSATTESWVNVLGANESESDTVSGERVLTVVEEGVSVTVPAGTFDCCKVKVETTTDGLKETEYWYYSDEVRFYVKQDAGDLGEGTLELEKYSVGGHDGVVSMFTGGNLWLTGLLIVIVVLIIAVAIAMRSRRRKTPTPITQPQPRTDIPPPPGPDGPEAPPDEPMQPPFRPPA